MTTDTDRSTPSTPSPPGDTSPETSLEQDTVFHLLQNERRRRALRCIADRDAPIDTRTLLEQVAAREYGLAVEDLTSDQRQRVYISLYQSHLPKLDEHAIVDYDQSSGVVTPTPLTDALVAYLSVGVDGRTEQDRWTTHYLVLSVTSALVLTATWQEVSVFRSVPALVVGALVAASFGASALGEWVYCRFRR